MVKKQFINDNDRKRIRDAIQTEELRTSGEIVTLITQESDDYMYIPLLYAALLALWSYGLLEWLAPYYSDSYGYITQIMMFFILGALFSWPPLKMKLIPSSVKLQRAKNKAYFQFFTQGINKTKDGTGILIFVSVAEHYVEIIADHGIYSKLPQEIWQSIVLEFIHKIKQGQVVNGFETAIHACGDLLHQHFPIEPKDINELPNHLIEL